MLSSDQLGFGPFLSETETGRYQDRSESLAGVAFVNPEGRQIQWFSPGLEALIPGLRTGARLGELLPGFEDRATDDQTHSPSVQVRGGVFARLEPVPGLGAPAPLLVTITTGAGKTDAPTRLSGHSSAAVSHELRGVLAAIEFETAAVSSTQAPRVPDASLSRIIRGIREARELIDRLGRESIVDTDAIRPIRMCALVRDALKRFEPSLPDNVHVRLDRSDCGGCLCDVDALAIRRAVTNLVTNAAEALNSVSRKGKISVSVHAKGRGVVVRVADNGPGLSQNTGAGSRRGSNTAVRGLGLAITDQVCRLHGGTFQVARTTGGAAFEMTFPAAVAVRDEQPGDRLGGSRTGEPEQGGLPPDSAAY
ncbi:MAG: HAMP domain-containing sensor histidine kinase [Planctomycetota bacterium]